MLFVRRQVPFINVQTISNSLCRFVALSQGGSKVREERRLIWRVLLRHWKNIADGGRLPSRDEIDLWLRGEDGANCLLIALGWWIELSYFIVVG